MNARRLRSLVRISLQTSPNVIISPRTLDRHQKIPNPPCKASNMTGPGEPMSPIDRSVLLALAALFFGQTPVPPSSSPTRPATTPAGQFDVSSLDRSADPCVDFYQFACGNWMRNNPIPADQARWGRFGEVAERNRKTLHEILEKASAPAAKRSALEQKYGDYYASCMDEAGIEAKGMAPLQPELTRIAALHNKAELIDEVARLNGTARAGRGEPGVRAL